MAKDDKQDDQAPDPSRRRLLKGIAGSLANAAAGKMRLAAPAVAPISIPASLAGAAMEATAVPAIESAALAVSAMSHETLLDDPRFRPVLRAMDAWGDYRAMYRAKDTQLLHKLKNAVLNGNVTFDQKDIFFLAQRMYGKQGADTAFHAQLLEESRALAKAAPSYETIHECLHHPALFDATSGNLTRGNPTKAAHELNAIARMDDPQLLATYEKEIGARIADLNAMRSLLEKLPAIKHRVMQKAGVAITDIPAFGIEYRAGESPIPTDYYTQPNPVTWRKRVENEFQAQAQPAAKA